MTESQAQEYGLRADEMRAVQRVFDEHEEVEEVILYGSRAKGTHRKGSDVDLALKGDGLSFATLNRIATDLDDLNLPYEIDLAIFRQINNQDLIEHIQRVGKRIYKR